MRGVGGVGGASFVACGKRRRGSRIGRGVVRFEPSVLDLLRGGCRGLRRKLPLRLCGDIPHSGKPAFARKLRNLHGRYGKNGIRLAVLLALFSAGGNNARRNLVGLRLGQVLVVGFARNRGVCGYPVDGGGNPRKTLQTSFRQGLSRHGGLGERPMRMGGVRHRLGRFPFGRGRANRTVSVGIRGA